MNAEEFRECLNTMGWHWTRVADMTGINTRTVSRWYSGATAVPDDIAGPLAAISTAMHQALEAHPLPYR